jgi:hypothetical protein
LEAEIRNQPRHIVPKTLSQKTKKQKTAEKRAGGVYLVIECLPSKSEALRSNTSSTKKKLGLKIHHKGPHNPHRLITMSRPSKEKSSVRIESTLLFE